MDAFSLRVLEAEMGRSLEFEDSLVYRSNSSTARATPRETLFVSLEKKKTTMKITIQKKKKSLVKELIKATRNKLKSLEVAHVGEGWQEDQATTHQLHIKGSP